MKRGLLLTLALPGLGFLTGALAQAEAPGLPGLGTLLLPGLIILVLVLLNGLYVAAEFAIIGARPTQLEPLAEAGNRTAAHVLGVQRSQRRQDQYIATAQLGITLASLGLGMYGEPQLAHFVEPYVAALFGLDPHAPVIRTAGYVIGLSALTYLHIVVGEMIPKSLALSSPVKTALGVSVPMSFSLSVFGPAVRALNGLGRLLLRLLRVPPAGAAAHLHSPEELELIVDESAEQGLVDVGEQQLVHNIFDFTDRHVHHVMTPRPQIQAVPSDLPLPDLLRLAAESPHSRWPVYEKDLDNILGVLHLHDLARHVARGKTAFDLRLLLRPVVAVPEHYPVVKVLAMFRRQRSQVAIVIDEFGGTAGLVTLEDLIEEVVGDLRDEFDRAPSPIQVLSTGLAMIDGLTSIEDVNDYFGLNLHDPHYNTIAGYVLGRLGRMARVGDSVEVEGGCLRVEALAGLRIARLSLARTADN